jgi:segregation and condensation protein B
MTMKSQFNNRDMRTAMTVTPKTGTAPPKLDMGTMDAKIALVEAVLFVSKDPVEPDKIMSYLNIADAAELNEIISRMDNRFKENHRGVFLKRTGGGLQLATKPVMHPFLQEFFSIKTTSRLTVPSLETLSIVAYRQPVTLAEISDLRGVNSVGPVKNLLQKKLIKISGRKKVPGNPALYSTTPEFLLYFGLNDLSQLPSLEELSEMFAEKEQPSLFK